MNRRRFLALASGLLVPAPTRAYSFLPGLWAPSFVSAPFTPPDNPTAFYSAVDWGAQVEMMRGEDWNWKAIETVAPRSDRRRPRP
jgi:hypothetical protein